MKRVLPARSVVCLLGFFGCFNMYAMRLNLSVAIVAMVTEPRVTSRSGEIDEACSELLADIPRNDTLMQQNSRSKGEFDWDPLTQGQVLGAFFYGYVVTQIPGGVLAERYGAKWLYGVGMLATSVLTLLTPIAARWSVWGLIVARGIEGLGVGVGFPVTNVLIARWAPKMERGRMTSLMSIGAPIGTVFTLAITGVMCDSGFLGGWPSVFYLFGTLGCIWFVLWSWLVYDCPEKHPSISEEELQHICRGQDKYQTKKLKTPWKSILTSVPLWALALAQFGKNWGAYTIQIQLPTYLFSILHFDIKKNGILSAAPNLAFSIGSVLACILADKLRARGQLRNSTIRKAFNSFGFFGSAICLLTVAHAGCRPALIVALITLSMGLLGSSNAGYLCTHVDMCPKLAGTLFGLTNCFSNFGGVLVPAYVGWIIKDGQTVERWSVIFITSSAVLIVTGTVYVVFGSADLQSWGNISPSDIGTREDEELETDALANAQNECKSPTGLQNGCQSPKLPAVLRNECKSLNDLQIECKSSKLPADLRNDCKSQTILLNECKSPTDLQIECKSLTDLQNRYKSPTDLQVECKSPILPAVLRNE